MTCDEYRLLIAKNLDGTIQAVEADTLKEHVLVCEECRKELAGIRQMESTLTAALAPVKSASQAREAVLAAIEHEVPIGAARERATAGASWRLTAAALVGLAAGFLIAFGLWGGAGTGHPPKPGGRPLPIQIARLEGTVLVKHAGAAVWEEMNPAMPLCIGDTLQSSEKSGTTLSLANGSRIVLSANSRLLLEHLDGGTRLKLDHGRMDLALKSPHPAFFVSTPNARVEALGTEFTVTVE